MFLDSVDWAMGSDWTSTAEFLKASGGPLGPSKTVHIDNDQQLTASEQTGGQLYAEQKFDATHQEPLMCCPNCGQPAAGVANAQSMYMREIKESSGKTHKGDLPKCPIVGLDDLTPSVLYSLEPCGCKVTVDFAGAFAAELQRRLRGEKPKALALLNEKDRQVRVERLTRRLTELYRLQALAGDTDIKKDIDYWIVVVVDQIQRYCPGAHNKVPLPLHAEVQNWADKNSLKQPEQPKKSIAMTANGTVVYFDKEGKYTDDGYTKDYKPPPGYKNTVPSGAPSCFFWLSETLGRFVIAWSDNFKLSYISFSEATRHARALKAAVSVIDRSRGAALEAILPTVARALDILSDYSAKAPKAKCTPAMCKAAETAAIAKVDHKLDPAKGWSKPSSLDFKSQLLGEFVKDEITKFLEVFSPEPKINFIGAKEEEKKVYLSALGKKPTVMSQDINVLLAAKLYFETDRGFMTSLVHEVVLQGQGDSVHLIQTAAAIEKDIQSRLAGTGNYLSFTQDFLDKFNTLVDTDAELKMDAAKPVNTVPAPVPAPLPPSIRHHKKRRTIRPMDEE